VLKFIENTDYKPYSVSDHQYAELDLKPIDKDPLGKNVTRYVKAFVGFATSVSNLKRNFTHPSPT